MMMYRLGHLRQASIVGPVLSTKPKGTIHYFWFDNKPKQQLQKPSPAPQIKKQTTVQPKPYASPKYTRKRRDNSKKSTNDQTGSESRGVNGEEIQHLPHVTDPSDTNSIRLPDGRLMGFAMYGRPDPERKMIPLVVEHGTPGTRLSCHIFHEWCHRNFVPIIAPERPGMGISTYADDYSVADHARDAMFLMRALGYRKYRVHGTSGGGPYALGIAALAHKNEVLVCGVMAGKAPIEASRRNLSPWRIWWSLVTRILPEWRAFQMNNTRRIQRFAQSEVFRATNYEERKYLETREKYIGDGVKGYIQDHNRQNQAWGFDLETIREKKIPVHMVYGDEDANTPLSGGLYLKDRIGPTCTLKVIPDTNHQTSQDKGAWPLLRKICEYK